MKNDGHGVHISYISGMDRTQEGIALGDGFKEARIKANLTVAALARRRMCSPQTIWRNETAHNLPGLASYKKTLSAIGVNQSQVIHLNRLWRDAQYSYGWTFGLPGKDPVAKKPVIAVPVNQPDPKIEGIVRAVKDSKETLIRTNAHLDDILSTIGAPEFIENRQAKRLKKLMDTVSPDRRAELEEWIALLEKEFGSPSSEGSASL